MIILSFSLNKYSLLLIKWSSSLLIKLSPTPSHQIIILSFSSNDHSLLLINDNHLLLIKCSSCLLFIKGQSSLFINDNPLYCTIYFSSYAYHVSFSSNDNLLFTSNDCPLLFQQMIILFSSRSWSLFHCESTATEDFRLLTMCPELQVIKSKHYSIFYLY
jgi:hypothetical protein